MMCWEESGGFFGDFERSVVGFRGFDKVDLFFIMEQLKDLFADVPFTDRDRVSEILQDEGVSLA